MGRIAVGRLNLGVDYDFVIDPSTGAVGTIGLGGTFPQNGIISRVVIAALTAFTSGGSAIISFGLRQIGVAAPVTFSTALAPAQGFAYYNTLDQLGNFVARPGNDFNANPLKLYTGYEVVMVISGAALTGGSLAMHIEYSQGTI